MTRNSFKSYSRCFSDSVGFCLFGSIMYPTSLHKIYCTSRHGVNDRTKSKLSLFSQSFNWRSSI